MTPLERQEEALIHKVRGTLETGKLVAVLGWMKSSHDSFTKRLLSGGKVIFFEKPPDRLGSSVGFAMFRMGTTHSDFHRVSSRTDCHPTVLSHGHIRRVLKAACEGQFVEIPAVREVATENPSVIVPEPVEVMSAPKLEVPTEVVRIAPEEKKMEKDMKGFITAFMKEAEKNGGLVGRYTLGDLRRTHGVKEVNPDLVKSGWITPVISEGRTEVGSYKASEKMLKEAGQILEVPMSLVDDPFARARAFIAKEPSIVDEILELEVKLEGLKVKMGQITAAKELLAKLTELTK